MERITASLAGRVVQALLEAGFDKQFASECSEESLLKAYEGGSREGWRQCVT